MTKSYFSFFLAFCLSLTMLSAQITLDNSYFPVAGDTLSTVTLIPQDGAIPITESGNNQLWDFSSISGGIANQVIYDAFTSTSPTDPFPEANLVVNGDGNQTFLRATDERFEILGFEGLDPAGLGIELVSRLTPPLMERSAPLDFLDFASFFTSSNIAFGADVLPGGLVDSLPFAPDSIRILVNLDVVDLVDAWGTVILPGNVSYETLRQKRIQHTETRLEVKVPILNWIDVTDQFANFGGGDGLLGMDTTIIYNHYAAGVKEPIAVLTLDAVEENVVSFEYRAEEPIISSAREVEEGFENVYAYPNPAINYANFDCVNLKPDYYDLKIYNILGLEKYQERNFISGNKKINVDLSSFTKGTYLYSLCDTTGKVIMTKRLVVIRP